MKMIRCHCCGGRMRQIAHDVKACINCDFVIEELKELDYEWLRSLPYNWEVEDDE